MKKAALTSLLHSLNPAHLESNLQCALSCRYYRFSGIKLPSMYNADFEMLLKTKSITASGARPLTIHFALDKPFDVGPDDYRWEYLCYRPKMVSNPY
jgi:hypothetical protein